MNKPSLTSLRTGLAGLAVAALMAGCGIATDQAATTATSQVAVASASTSAAATSAQSGAGAAAVLAQNQASHAQAADEQYE